MVVLSGFAFDISSNIRYLSPLTMKLKYKKVYVGSAGKKGRGVFARKPFKKGEVIEVSPYIGIPHRDDKKLIDTIINSYWFELDKKTSAIGLGLTSMYNHSQAPNAQFSTNRKKRTITIKTLRRIRPKEEITIDYGYSLDL